MKAGRTSRYSILVNALACLLLTACASTAPTRFYLLDPVAKQDGTVIVAGQEQLSIALATVELPDHLKRPQIVTRQKGHRVDVDEFNRWAEPLDAGFTAALAENLSRLLGTDRVYIVNRTRITGVDYQVAVKVLRFDGWPGGEATLVCRWEIVGKSAPETRHIQRFSTTRQVAGPGYADLVAALSSMLADLSRDIAGQLSAGR